MHRVCTLNLVCVLYFNHQQYQIFPYNPMSAGRSALLGSRLFQDMGKTWCDCRKTFPRLLEYWDRSLPSSLWNRTLCGAVRNLRAARHFACTCQSNRSRCCCGRPQVRARIGYAMASYGRVSVSRIYLRRCSMLVCSSRDAEWLDTLQHYLEMARLFTDEMRACQGSGLRY